LFDCITALNSSLIILDSVNYYLGWLDAQCYEYAPIEECQADEYLVLEFLPTMDEVHQKYIEELKKGMK